MMQECICTLVVDDYDEVSIAAQELLDHLFSERGKHHVESDIIKIFSRHCCYCLFLSFFPSSVLWSVNIYFLLCLVNDRLLERLPKVVLRNEEVPALSVAKQLLVVTYYSGPRFLADHLQSPVCILS